MTLRVGYVPEHFSSPLLQLARSSWGKDNLTLVSQPSGTGQMLVSLKDDADAGGRVIDVAVALTESLIAPLANGRSDYKLVGSYVRSPLNWAVITGTSPNAERYQSIKDLRGEAIGISRIGSGSMVMASVMALQQGWTDEQGKVRPIEFKVQNTFEKLRQGVNFPASSITNAAQDSTSSSSTADAHITAPQFAAGAQAYVAKHEAPPSSSGSLGSHLYAAGWTFQATPVAYLRRTFSVIDSTSVSGTPRTLHATQSIAHSSTWRAPVLYLEAHTDEGSPLSLAEIEASSLLTRNVGAPTSLPAGATSADADSSQWARLGAAEHPASGAPCAMLHPCETAAWLGLLQSSTPADASTTEEAKSVAYIEAFMTLCASAVEMRPGGTGADAGHDNVEKPETGAFMWEWFTTKPFVDAGEVRFIGSVPTPWPSWTIACSSAILSSESGRASLDAFLQRLATSITSFSSDADAARSFVQSEMGYEPADVASWFERVRWAGDARANPTLPEGEKHPNGQSTHTSSVSKETLESTLDVLQQAGVVSKPEAGWQWSNFVDEKTSEGKERLVD